MRVINIELWNKETNSKLKTISWLVADYYEENRRNEYKRGLNLTFLLCEHFDKLELTIQDINDIRNILRCHWVDHSQFKYRINK